MIRIIVDDFNVSAMQMTKSQFNLMLDIHSNIIQQQMTNSRQDWGFSTSILFKSGH